MKKPLVGLLLLAAHQVSNGASDSQDALELNVEDLLSVEVTSVSKKAQALNDSAAAVFVSRTTTSSARA